MCPQQNHPSHLLSHTPHPQNDWFPSEDELKQIEALLKGSELNALKNLLLKYHYSAHADIIQFFDSLEERIAIAYILSQEGQYGFWAELDDLVRNQLLESLKAEDIQHILESLETDDAVSILEEIPDEKERETILQSLGIAEAVALRKNLSWPEETAGRLMKNHYIAVPDFYTVGDTIDWFRQHAEKDQQTFPDDFYSIFLVSPHYKLLGQVSLARLLSYKRDTSLKDITESQVSTIYAGTLQHEVAFQFKQQDIVVAPVIDDHGRLLGVITVDDIVDVIEEEYEADILALGGVQDEDIYANIRSTSKARLKWLMLNTLTALLSSVAVNLFSNVIQMVVALAALMPVVSSLGGNAGTQTLTIAVRALATRKLISSNTWKFIRKEIYVSILNGLGLALIVGSVTYFWQHDILLAAVMGLSICFNMLTAGLAGAIIPLGLFKLGVDPAIASSVILTAITDIVGFVVFLGLASLILM